MGRTATFTYIVAKNRKMFNVFAKKYCKETVNSSGRRMASRFLDDLLQRNRLAQSQREHECSVGFFAKQLFDGFGVMEQLILMRSGHTLPI